MVLCNNWYCMLRDLNLTIARLTFAEWRSTLMCLWTPVSWFFFQTTRPCFPYIIRKHFYTTEYQHRNMTHTSCFNDIKELRFFFIMYREVEIAFELATECCAMNLFSTMNLRNYIQDLRKTCISRCWACNFTKYRHFDICFFFLSK